MRLVNNKVDIDEENYVFHEAEMFANNDILCLLNFNVLHRGDRHEIIPQEGSNMPITFYLREHRIDHQVYGMICRGVKGAIMSARSYLLEPLNIAFELEGCYIGEESIRFLYLPMLKREHERVTIRESLIAFFGEIEVQLSRNDTKIVQMHHQVMLALNEVAFETESFCLLLEQQVICHD